MTTLVAPPLLSIGARRACAAEACIRDLDGRTVAWLAVGDGSDRGAIGVAEGEVMERLVRTACAAGIPIVGVFRMAFAEAHEGIASLHAWGRVARALADASGVVPIVLAVAGPCTGGSALLLGLADVVVFTSGAFAYISGPRTVAAFTSVAVDEVTLGGAAAHARGTGLASLVVEDEEKAVTALCDVLSYLPANNLELAPTHPTADDPGRPCRRAADCVPASASSCYDAREVIADVVDDGSFLELSASFAPNLVVGFARLDGHAVGVLANQSSHMAGTLDIQGSQKGARFVQRCDAFNIPIVTFVDTPGYRPGKDLEWRGLIRHGAQLVHAYAAATVPRLAVILRKAYGGGYIVMDSRGVGNDYCAAWPDAEIAVMGAASAVAVLHRQRLASIADPVERAAERAVLEAVYHKQYCTPEVAAERGFVDEVVDPLETRSALIGGLRALRTKRETLVRRRHANEPL
jgi:acetyl-CoA carboxylase carboxyltransferase component